MDEPQIPASPSLAWVTDFRRPPLYHGVGEGVWLIPHSQSAHSFHSAMVGIAALGKLALPQGHS